MGTLSTIIVYSLFSGLTVFLGGILSKLFNGTAKDGMMKNEILHTSTAFGGGIIIAAVAFVLVPRGMAALPLFPMIAIFTAGAMTFFFLDRFIERKGGSAAQILAMLMDFVPEAISLGAVFAHDINLGLLLAIFIGLQNLPESFNSYVELQHSGYSSRKSLWVLFTLSFSGVIASLLGYYLLRNSPTIIASLMLFSGGGILYLIFQDIAPLSKLAKSWFPALGACMGFLIGMIGQKLLG